MDLTYYKITELNTRKKTYKNPVRDIFEGDDYKSHKRNTLDEAKALAAELYKKGIHTNIAHVTESN